MPTKKTKRPTPKHSTHPIDHHAATNGAGHSHGDIYAGRI